MPPIRVLVVDDSAVIRRMVSDALSQDPMLEVAGTAPNGRIALARIPLVQPDAVVLDVDMPELDGLQTLAAIRKTDPWLPVILFSSLAERGAAITLDALMMGASDYVTKPSSAGGSSSVEERIRGQLIPRIKAMRSRPGAPAVGQTGSRSTEPQTLPRKSRSTVHSRVEVVAIGASTGGPAALCEILPRLPADFPVPVLIVQHMPPIFTRLLSERLEALSALRVLEGTSADTLSPGTAWVAPGDFHMVVEGSAKSTWIQKNKEPSRNSCRPSVDALFESVARRFGAGTLAVMLTGMGQDGLEGCERVREAGGQILAQDESSSVVWGMPGAVARAGLADEILPLGQIAEEILRRVNPRGALRPVCQTSIAEEHE